MEKKNHKWTIFWAIIILWIIGGIGLVLSIKDNIDPATRTVELVKISLLIIGGLGVVMPAFLSSWQSIENYNIAKEKMAFDRIENAFRLIDKWDDPALSEARAFTRELASETDQLAPKQLIERINGDLHLKKSFIMVFNFWEKIRISILHDRIDEKIMRDAFCEGFKRQFEMFTPWLKENDITPGYYADLKILYDRWSK